MDQPAYPGSSDLGELRMIFPVFPTLTSYMARSRNLPPCAGALANIFRGCHEGTLRLLILSNITQRVRAISPALVLTPGQQDSTVTGLSGSLRYAIKFQILHLIGLCSKFLLHSHMIWNLNQYLGDQHG